MGIFERLFGEQKKPEIKITKVVPPESPSDVGVGSSICPKCKISKSSSVVHQKCFPDYHPKIPSSLERKKNTAPLDIHTTSEKEISEKKMIRKAAKRQIEIQKRSFDESDIDKFEKEKDLDNLIEALDNQDDFIRGKAAGALGKLKNPRALPYLINHLFDSFHIVRSTVIRSLWEIGDPIVIVKIIDFLDNEPDASVRRDAVLFLGKFKDARAIKPLIKSTTDSEFVVREAAIESLGFFNDPQVIKILIGALNDTSWVIRKKATESLGHLKDPLATKALIDKTNDPHTDVRKAAIYSLGEIGDPNAYSQLVFLLESGDWTIQHEAFFALGKIKDDRAADYLIQYINLERKKPNPNFSTIKTTICMLGEFGNEQVFDFLIREIERTENKNNRDLLESCINALGYSDDIKREEYLYQMLKGNRCPEQTLNALLAIAKRRKLTDINPIINLLKSDNEKIQIQSIELLKLSADPRSVDPLLELLNKKKSNAVIYALISIKDKRVFPEIIKYINDSDTEIRAAVASALGEFNDPSSFEQLTYMLRRVPFSSTLGNEWYDHRTENSYSSNDEIFEARSIIKSLGMIHNVLALDYLIPLFNYYNSNLNDYITDAIKEIIKNSKEFDIEKMFSWMRGSPSFQPILKIILIDSGYEKELKKFRSAVIESEYDIKMQQTYDKNQKNWEREQQAIERRKKRFSNNDNQD
jgi:HEAT repeat protein